MKNRFTFQSVGHGLFYTGSLLNGQFNFVYDCGGNKEPLKKAISDYAAEVEKIDFLVVSHLHEDHIRGIYDLQKKWKKIEKIYLPYLGENKLIIELAIANFLPITAEQELLEIFHWWVNLYSSEQSEIVTEEKEITYPTSETEKPYWYFKMFNRIKNNKNIPIDVPAIEREIKTILGNKKIEDYLFDKKNRQKLREAYEKCFLKNKKCSSKNKKCSSKDINDSSTILIHYPANNNVFFVSEDYNCFGCYLLSRIPHYMYERIYERYSVITILTGDAEFDKDMLANMQKIISNKEGIKIFQVPHHGAIDSWNSINSMKFSFDIYVISFNCGDKKHPDCKVLFELMSARKYISPATQFGEYSYRIEPN